MQYEDIREDNKNIWKQGIIYPQRLKPEHNHLMGMIVKEYITQIECHLKCQLIRKRLYKTMQREYLLQPELPVDNVNNKETGLYLPSLELYNSTMYNTIVPSPSAYDVTSQLSRGDFMQALPTECKSFYCGHLTTAIRKAMTRTATMDNLVKEATFAHETMIKAQWPEQEQCRALRAYHSTLEATLTDEFAWSHQKCH